MKNVFAASIVILSLMLTGFSPRLLQRPANTLIFAVIGDYGMDNADERRVATLVKSWSPEFIITTGDNNYPLGEQATLDANIGKYYAEYIYPYTGAYTKTATMNRFFPSMGNHDWYTAGATPYLNYFALPGNERYYDFIWGPVHFFSIDSDGNEPDGITVSSAQANWLQTQLAASTSCWNLVYLHHAPYSSGPHGSNATLQWQYKSWGADAVLAGHDHDYERIYQNGLVYFVNGTGGAALYSFGAPIAGSLVRYNAKHGAMRVTATDSSLTYELINVDGVVIDTYLQVGGCALLTPSIFMPLIRK